MADNDKPEAIAMSVRRRELLLGAGSLAIAAATGGCGKSEAATLAATSGATFAAQDVSPSTPETPNMRFGIIALTDCSPIVIAHEKGLFRKYGINSTVTKAASWAAMRDAVANGDVQAAHMLFGMPIASSMGLRGSPVRPMIAPWILNRNGQAISLKKDWKGVVQEDPRALLPLAEKAKAEGDPLRFAMTFPPGTHAMWLRYFLGAGGIHPDRDVALLTIPPAQMIANMRIGRMDGYCVGEPWNARAVAEGVGFTAITSQKIWPDHPEKVCAFSEKFATQNPKTVKAVLKALHEASLWLDEPMNRAELAATLSRPSYVNCKPGAIQSRLEGSYDYGDGRKEVDPRPMIFSVRNCNLPQHKYGKWWLTQFRRWGFVDGAPDYEGIPSRVLRADIYSAAMAELGVEHPDQNDERETFFDGLTFDPKDPEGYAQSFAIHSRRG